MLSSKLFGPFFEKRTLVPDMTPEPGELELGGNWYPARCVDQLTVLQVPEYDNRYVNVQRSSSTLFHSIPSSNLVEPFLSHGGCFWERNISTPGPA